MKGDTPKSLSNLVWIPYCFLSIFLDSIPPPSLLIAAEKKQTGIPSITNLEMVLEYYTDIDRYMKLFYTQLSSILLLKKCKQKIFHIFLNFFLIHTLPVSKNNRNRAIFLGTSHDRYGPARLLDFGR